MRPLRLLLRFVLLACLALLVAAPVALANPRAESALVTLAQQTGGSFGGSRWGSGSSGGSSSSRGSWSGGSSSSSSRGSWSSGRSSRSSDDSGAFDLVVMFIYLVVWCFSVSPILGLAVLGVGIGFVVFMFMLRS